MKRQAYAPEDRPWYARGVRAAANRVLGEEPIRRQAVEAAARERTGLTDFGDPVYAESLEQLLRSAEEDACLDPLGRLLFRRAVTGSLANRLRFVEARKQDPDALTEAPRQPVIIASMPRTGSTLMVQLLAEHPDALSLPLWLAIRPFPPPAAELWAVEGRGSRGRQEAELTARAVGWLAPDQMLKHEVVPTGRVECSHLQMHTYQSIQWWGIAPVSSYIRWLGHQDVRPAYVALREQLQLLQSRLPGSHWALKSPGHFYALGELLETFPNAKVVMIHRDPAKVVRSTWSLLASGHGMTSLQYDREETAAVTLDGLATAAERVVQIRRKEPAERFFDVAFPEFVADPGGTAARIRDWAGVPPSPVRAPTGKGRKHHYRGFQSETSLDAIRCRFSSYIDMFSIEAEQ